MRLGIVVNEVATEWPHYTTTRLAMTAIGMGHEVWYIGVGEFGLNRDNRTYAIGVRVPERTFRSPSAFLRTIQREVAGEIVSVDELDVLFLRNNPNDDTFVRPWARTAGINFGLRALPSGVVVLNDPVALAQSLTKLYLQSFPEAVRPQTIVTRHREEARAFINELGGYAVIKPLAGSGGRNVFLVRPEDAPNLNQMFEAVTREGYMIAQEYLPAAVHGDTRLFLMNGEPLRSHGRMAVVHRSREAGDPDMRSNITAGGVASRAEVTDELLGIAAALRPKLIEDGIFFAGVDVVGDKVMEINVLSPGALFEAEKLEGVSFSKEVIRALEGKVELRRRSPELTNVELATL